MQQNFINVLKYLGLFLFHGILFFIVSIFIDYSDGFAPLFLGMGVLYIIDKLESNLLLNNNLFYLGFQLLSLIIYILLYFYIINRFIIIDNTISFYFCIAIIILIIKSILSYTGKIEKWINKMDK